VLNCEVGGWPDVDESGMEFWLDIEERDGMGDGVEMLD